MELSSWAKRYLAAEEWADQHELEMLDQLLKEREQKAKEAKEKESLEEEKEKTT